MIKSVAKAIQTYSMSTFDVPSKVCDNLDVLTKSFGGIQKIQMTSTWLATNFVTLRVEGPLVLKRATNLRREMLQPQIILQYFYWSSSESSIDISFSFTNNHSPHQ